MQATMRAHAASAYSDCVDAADPAECLVRRALESSDVRPVEVLDAVLRHGLVDLVPGKSAELFRGLARKIDDSGATLNPAEAQLRYYRRQMALHQGEPKSLLAAMALVAAARHETDPFANPVYLELADEAKDPRIPVLAMALWVEMVEMTGKAPDFRVTHAGLPAIWERAVGPQGSGRGPACGHRR